MDFKNIYWVFAFLIIGIQADGENKLSFITVTNGGPWGNWGPIVVCPEDARAVGFSLKVEWDQGALGDNTALNGIRLYCVDFNYTKETVIESTTAEWGIWEGRVSCLFGGYLTSFVLRTQPAFVKSGDDTAANSLMFKCNSGEILDGNGMHFGDWGNWSGECENGVCGIQTKVEPDQGILDDTALNDVQFFCC